MRFVLKSKVMKAGELNRLCKEKRIMESVQIVEVRE